MKQKAASVQLKNSENSTALFDDDFLSGDFLTDIDNAFEQIQIAPTKKTTTSKRTTKTKRKPSKRKTAQYEMQSTYIHIAQNHLRPVLRYLKAIEKGVVTKDLCELVHYVVGPLVGKTRKVGLDGHTKALIGFQRELKRAIRSGSRTITKDQQTAIIKAFSPVRAGFMLELRGHSAAVVNLLGFYRAVKRRKSFTENDLKKLFSIGIPSLTMLRKTKLEEIKSLSGLNAEKASELRYAARNFEILSLL